MSGPTMRALKEREDKEGEWNREGEWESGRGGEGKGGKGRRGEGKGGEGKE